MRDYAFDAGLLWWNATRLLGEWLREDVVARAVPIQGPHPPAWADSGYHPPPGLRLEDREGLCLAEVRPTFWGDDAREVFRVLTSAGWPEET
ncbi:MAG: hypothetical protein ACRD12_00005 [Acidimicrobiales bacterium]